MANDFAWFYLLFFLIPLARVVPRLIRKYRGKSQGRVETFPQKPRPQTKTDTTHENTKDSTNSQSKDIIVLGELNRGVNKFESIQKNTGLDGNEINSVLEDLEKRGLMKVIRKQGLFGTKVELYPTNEGSKKYYS